MSGAGRLLIVNADDFGMTPGVSEGILHAFEHGVVSSTSALVIAPAFDKYAASLRDSGLGVGAHLAIVGEDPPLLSAREIPSLVDHRGRLPLSWRGFVRRAARNEVDLDDVRREFGAQLDKLTAAGIAPTHLDSHQNLHLWPLVAKVVVDEAVRRRIGAIRMCQSAGWSPIALGVRVLSMRLRQRAGAYGCAFPERSIALHDLGAPMADALLAAIAGFATGGAGSAEIIVHLGMAADPERRRYRSRFDWAAELEAVCDRRVVGSVAANDLTLGSFGDLHRSARLGQRST